MAAAAIPLMLGTGAIGAMGALRQGFTAQAAAQAEAAQMDQRAASTITEGMQRDELQRRQARQQIGLQLAGSAEAGGGINADQLRQSIYDAEMDSAAIRYGAMTEAQGLRYQAQITRWQGRQARTAGYLNAANSVLNAASNAAYMGGKK